MYLSDNAWTSLTILLVIIGFSAWFTFVVIFITKQNKKYSGLQGDEDSRNFSFNSYNEAFSHASDKTSQNHLDYSSPSHSTDYGCYGVNPATNLPLSSSGTDISGNPIGSNYSSSSYTGYHS